MSDDGVVNLCVAIVRTACDEYKSLWKAKDRGSTLQKEINRARRDELERFFCSEWFDNISFGVSDPKTIIESLKK